MRLAAMHWGAASGEQRTPRTHLHAGCSGMLEVGGGRRKNAREKKPTGEKKKQKTKEEKRRKGTHNNTTREAEPSGGAQAYAGKLVLGG